MANRNDETGGIIEDGGLIRDGRVQNALKRILHSLNRTCWALESLIGKYSRDESVEKDGQTETYINVFIRVSPKTSQALTSISVLLGQPLSEVLSNIVALHINDYCKEKFRENAMIKEEKSKEND